MTNAVALAQMGGISPSWRNRIINGDMTIDQRNAGASVTPANGANTYTIDRWAGYANQTSKFTVQQNAGAVTPPVGFRNYLGATSSSAYSIVSTDIFLIRQAIEGFNTADLMWGTANASTVTLSFWVRSSLTGTFGGSINNDSGNRFYPFSYTISSANTWEQKSVTIAGDTTGTWGTTNGVGIWLNLSIGTGSSYLGTAGAWTASIAYGATGQTNLVATNGATFYITGVQLEKGSVATSFDYLPYGTELMLCQRYYEVAATTGNYASVVCSCFNTSDAYCQIQFKVQKRASASVSISAFGNWSFYGNGSQRTINAIQTQNPSDTTFQVKISSAGTFPGGNAAHLDFNPTITAANGGGWTAAAEL
jgi:hypothetical protein